MLILVGVVVLAAAGTLTVVLLRSSNKSTAAGGASSSTCASGVTLQVAAAPAIAPVLSEVATNWAKTKPVVDGACPTVVVRSVTGATEAVALAKPDVTLPDVWVPDSSLWIQQLKADTAGIDAPVQSLWSYPSIASSPLVLATTSANLAAVTASAATGWAGALAATAPVSMLDPTTSTDGLLTLLTAQSLLPGAAGEPSRALVGTYVGLTRSVLTGTDAGFLALTQHPAGQMTFPASEQEVRAANANSQTPGTPVASSVYPTGKSLSLDFPIAQFAPAGGSPAQRDSAIQFIAELAKPFAQSALRAAGLRDAAGTALPAAAGATTTPAVPAADLLTPPTVAQMSDSLRVWSAAGKVSRTLLVIDTSGSMADTIGGGQSKIEFAAAAEKAAIDFFPDTTSLGLWTFAQQAKPKNDWTEVVPLGPLSSTVTPGVTRRQAMITAGTTLPNRTDGDTGLYNTTLAAFEAVRAGYNPAAANSVVLLTDGANTDTTGIDLATLLARLRTETSSTAPLPIITIAIGKNADVATLKQISEATGGSTLTAAQPADIRDAVLDALVKAG